MLSFLSLFPEYLCIVHQSAGVLDRAYALAFNRRVSTSLVFIIGVIGIAIGVIAGIAIWVLTRKKK